MPPLLRLGANPGFHEGIGELISLASSQVPYLQAKGILPADFKADKTAFLLDDALARSIPFMFFASGTMTHWEADIYAHQLEPDDWNDRWWNYVERIPRRRAAEQTRRRMGRLCDQDAHQRHARLLLQLRVRDGAEIPIARLYRAKDPSSTAAVV